MSGIAVIWNRDGRPVDGAQIVRMTELMKHRGPDGERHWRRGPVAIGHCALNTTPEALADQQPLIDEAAGLCITFDGRIDNREELKTLLDINGSDLISVSDPRLVLAAYRKWGEACVEHLLGDFAFAVWDERQQRLFCARDFLGVRPLFYALVGDTFVCASEVRALFALPGLKREPNLAAITARLLRHCIEFDDTLFMGVSRLPMAHCLSVTRDAARRGVIGTSIPRERPATESMINTLSIFASCFSTRSVAGCAASSRLRDCLAAGWILPASLALPNGFAKERNNRNRISRPSAWSSSASCLSTNDHSWMRWSVNAG